MKGSFSFDFCYREPHSNECIAVEIELNWRSPKIFYCESDRERGSLHHDLCLKAESRFVDNDFNLFPLFRVTETERQLVLRRGNKRLRVPLLAAGAGGNWHWRTYKTSPAATPFLMNWLRAVPHLDLTEWETDFRSLVWNQRGSIRKRTLQLFARQTLRETLKQNGGQS